MRISDWSSDVCSSDLHNHSSASHAHQSLVFLTLRTASGVVAYGEGGTPAGTAFWGGESSETIKCVIDRYLAPALRGVNLFAHERVLQAMDRSEEHTSELQSLMRISYAVFCLKKKKQMTKCQRTK